MTRAVLACLLLFVPAQAGAQSDDELIAEALLPLPEYLKDGATVTIRDDAGRRRVIQEGTSGLRCSPDGPGLGFLVSCIDDSSGPVLQEFRRHLAQGRSPREAMDAVTAAARAGAVATATPGGMIWILSGESRNDLIPMVGALVPFATGHVEKQIPGLVILESPQLIIKVNNPGKGFSTKGIVKQNQPQFLNHLSGMGH